MIRPLILLLLCKIHLTWGFNYTALIDPTGIFIIKAHNTYISFNNWKFIYYYNLEEYYQDMELFRNCLNKMKFICSRINEKEPCEALISKHMNMQNNIEINTDYIESIIERKNKRDAILLPVTKYFMKPVYGIIDEEDAQEIYSKINQLIDKQKTESMILQENLSIVARTIQTANRSLETLRSNLVTFSSYVENITENISNMEKDIINHINFGYISSLATLIIIEHDHITRIIKETIKNTLRGEFTELITFEQLSKDLKDVTFDLDDSSFFIMDKLQDLQEVMSIKGTILRRKMLVEITIPLINKSLFKLYQIVSLPMRYDNEAIIIKTENQNYLVNNETRTFLPIQISDLQNCKQIFNRSLLCYPHMEMYFENEKMCESNILFEQDTKTLIDTCDYQRIADMNYIKRLTDNSYHISIKSPLEVRENCIKQLTKSYTINQTGILKIDLNCEIILNNMKISPRNIKTREKIFNIMKPYKFQLISIKNLSTIKPKLGIQTLPKVKFLSTTNDFADLINATNKNIEILRNSITISHIKERIFKWNTITILIILLIIIFLVIKIIKRCN